MIVGLFVLAWMILMQDVRVGLPGLVTVAPVEGRAGSPDGGSSTRRDAPAGSSDLSGASRAAGDADVAGLDFP